jgi:hypothetical protein
VPDVIDVEFQLPDVLALRMVRPPEQLPGEMAMVIAGPPGDAVFSRQSDGPLSALRVVWEDGAGVVRPLGHDDGSHIDLIAGLTLTATAVTGAVRVQRAGPVDDAAWSWMPGRVWLGPAGALTQTPPADGYDVLVGYAVSPTRLYLDIQDPIQLED